jgi:hypothetical protein
MGDQDRFTSPTWVAAHQFMVAEGSYLFEPPPLPANGLFGADPGRVTIYAGISSGIVNVTVEPRTAAPTALDAGEWEEISEADLVADVGNVIVRAIMDDAPDLPALTTRGPGTYRVRVYARGRDRQTDLATLEAVEDYLIQAWPSEASQPDAVIKQSDAFGRIMRQPATTSTAPPPREAPPKRVPNTQCET